MPNLVYSIADYIPFNKILASDHNTIRDDIKSRLNWDGTANTGLNDANVQSNTVSGGGLTRSSKLKAGTADYVVINDADGKVSEEAQLAVERGGLGFEPSFTGNSGRAVVVNDTEDAFELGSPLQSTLTQSLAGDISSLTAGEAISIRDAVCLDLSKNASNSDIYRVFKCDSDLAYRRRNFLGFAVDAASVVAGTYTWTDSAALVSSNVITWKINGRNYSQNFNTDNDTTLAAIATQIASDYEVQSASVVDAGSNDRVINITSKGGLFLNITSATVTGGVSQAIITIATTQAPSGENVVIRNFGLLDGFTSLTVGAKYYLSGTTGEITTSPTDSAPIYVGQALSSTQLFINPNFANYQFSSPEAYIVSHGATTNSDATVTATSHHFNFTSWSAGTSDSSSYRAGNQGNAGYNGYHHVINGITSASGSSTHLRTYNKAAWAAATAPSTFRAVGSAAVFNNKLYACKGGTANGLTFYKVVDSWNGSSWTNAEASLTDNANHPAAFTEGGLLRVVSGGTSSEIDTHETYDGVSAGTDTVIPVGAFMGGGTNISSGMGFAGPGVGTTASYVWSGSWSTSITVPFQSPGSTGSGIFKSSSASGYASSANVAFVTGGYNGTSVLNNNGRFNGSTWASDTVITTAKCGVYGSVF